MVKTKTPPTKKNPPETVKEEMNLTEIPFCYPSKRLPKELKEIIWERTETSKNGETLKRRIEVRYPTTEIGERVYLGLMELSKEANFPQIVNNFSIYKLIHLLGMDSGGKSRKEIKRALRELHEVSIYAKEAFWDNKQKRYVSTVEKGFHIIDDWEIKKKGEIEDGYFKWSDVIYNSIVKNGYIKSLNFKYYLQLEDSLARRLYRYLDKRMHNFPVMEIDIFELAVIVGLVNYKYVSQIRQRLDLALEELKTTGFLVSYGYKDKKLKIEKSKVPPRLTGKGEEEKETKLDDTKGNIAKSFNLKIDLIEALIEEHGRERVQRAYEYAKKKAEINPAGFFMESLRAGYDIGDETISIDVVRKLKIEAEKCYKNCFGHCAAEYRESSVDRENKACYWCVKFSEERKKEQTRKVDIN